MNVAVVVVENGEIVANSRILEHIFIVQWVVVSCPLNKIEGVITEGVSVVRSCRLSLSLQFYLAAETIC